MHNSSRGIGSKGLGHLIPHLKPKGMMPSVTTMVTATTALNTNVW